MQPPAFFGLAPPRAAPRRAARPKARPTRVAFVPPEALAAQALHDLLGRPTQFAQSRPLWRNLGQEPPLATPRPFAPPGRRFLRRAHLAARRQVGRLRRRAEGLAREVRTLGRAAAAALCRLRAWTGIVG